jgi:hypothetical protein
MYLKHLREYMQKHISALANQTDNEYSLQLSELTVSYANTKIHHRQNKNPPLYTDLNQYHSPACVLVVYLTTSFSDSDYIS